MPKDQKVRRVESANPFGRKDVQVTGQKTAYHGFFKVIKHTLRHRLFAGGWSQEITRECLVRGDAVAVLPYDPVTDRVLLIEQFRVGALGSKEGPWVVESIAGIVEEGESPEDVARREALEEANCEITRLIRIGSYFPSPGGCSEEITLYCGIAQIQAGEGFYGLEDEGEDIRVFSVSSREAFEMLGRDELRSGSTIISLQWLKEALSKKGVFGAQTSKPEQKTTESAGE